jgi:hypothetical protein
MAADSGTSAVRRPPAAARKVAGQRARNPGRLSEEDQGRDPLTYFAGVGVPRKQVLLGVIQKAHFSG